MMTFNFLLVVNLTRNVLNLTVREESGEVKKFNIAPFGKRTDVPQRFMEQIIDEYSSMGVLVQEQPINYLGELSSAPSRVSEGYSGDFGYFEGRPYYCISDKIWISNPPLDGQENEPSQEELDSVTNPPRDTDTGSTPELSSYRQTVINKAVQEPTDGSRKSLSCLNHSLLELL